MPSNRGSVCTTAGGPLAPTSSDFSWRRNAAHVGAAECGRIQRVVDRNAGKVAGGKNLSHLAAKRPGELTARTDGIGDQRATAFQVRPQLLVLQRRELEARAAVHGQHVVLEQVGVRELDFVRHAADFDAEVVGRPPQQVGERGRCRVTAARMEHVGDVQLAALERFVGIKRRRDERGGRVLELDFAAGGVAQDVDPHLPRGARAWTERRRRNRARDPSGRAPNRRSNRSGSR